MEDFACQRLFFRRVRIPSLLGITWDTIWISPTVDNLFLRRQISSEEIEQQIKLSFDLVCRMHEMLKDCDHPLISDIDLLKETVAVMSHRRRLAYGDESGASRDHLEQMMRNQISPMSYQIKFVDTPFWQSVLMMIVIKGMVRRKSEYRIWDQIFTIRLCAWVFPFLYTLIKKKVPKDLRDQAMGVECLFK